MDCRGLGRTGMQASPLCLGAMMFGAWGERDHDVSIKIIHRALNAAPTSSAPRMERDIPESQRAQRLPRRQDLSIPGNQAKLDAVEELALFAEEAGLSLIHLAFGFTPTHPAGTAPIISPHTMEVESQLGAADVTLSNDIPDHRRSVPGQGAERMVEGAMD